MERLNLLNFNKIAILDRDGVLNFNNINNGYIGYKKHFKWYPGAKKTIKYLKSLNYKVVVVTNQSGVARNYFSYKDVLNLHKTMQIDLNRHGTKIDNFFFCGSEGLQMGHLTSKLLFLDNRPLPKADSIRLTRLVNDNT